MNKINRKSNRYKNFNYEDNGYYFVTVCTQDRMNYFGEIQNDRMILNQYGNIVNDRWLWLQDQYDYVKCDEYVIMPNHFHGVLIIDTVGTSRNLSSNQNNINRTGLENNINRTGLDQIRTGLDLSLPKVKSLSELIGAFKTTSSKLIHQNGIPEFRWQRSFYDHIIRNEKSLNNILRYIHNNPMNWDKDEHYIIQENK